MSDGGFPAEWWQMGAADVGAALNEQVAVMRREYARTLELLAFAEQSGAMSELGYPSAGRMYSDLARVDLADGNTMARRARAVHGEVSLSGTVVEPALPNTAKAFADGEIGEEHLDTIRRFHESLSNAVDPASWEIAEEYLATASRDTTPRVLDRDIRILRARIDSDGKPPDDRELANPNRQLRTTWHGDSLFFDGKLDRETGMLLEAALSPLAKPRPEQDGERDHRSLTERYGDAFAELVRLGAASNELPEAAGEPVTILVTVQEKNLRDGIGEATTTGGATMPATQLRHMACGANVIPAVLNTRGEVLDLGRTTRVPSRALRHALALRDGGCAHPHCDLPPHRAQAHHIVAWMDGGETALHNLVLLCPYHHRLIHYAGWTVRMMNGRPEFRPPGYCRRMSDQAA